MFLKKEIKNLVKIYIKLLQKKIINLKYKNLTVKKLF